MRSVVLYSATIVLFSVLLSTAVHAAEPARQPLVTLDEKEWVVFYDVPSRRFRNIRTNFVQRRFDDAAADLNTAATHLSIEAARSQPAIGGRLSEVADSLWEVAENIADESITVADLDQHFGRAHWLLAQHYLHKARQTRDRREYRNCGLYLWASTHHLERAVLWSNARIDRKLHRTLESLREMAARLQDPETAQKAANEKPIIRAEALLRELGESIDRPVVLPRPSG